MASELSRVIDSYRQSMVDTLSRIVAIKSISPESGGQGESKRADYIERLMRSWGFATKRFDYKDNHGVTRSSVVVRLGTQKRTIWSVCHIDTVSEGDISLWKTDPFKATVKGGKIFGRGTSDNGQAGISSMYAMRALKETRARMNFAFGIAFVADEEIGSVYGIQKLLKEKLFGKDDLFIVPDAGDEEGRMIEVAEKSIMWVKITVLGKQVHASTPAKGVNANRYMIRYLGKVDEYLHRKYTKTNALFAPQSASTFEMTKREKNVDSVNIIPGTDVAYIDCRVLPEYKLDSVLNDLRTIARAKEFKPARIKVDIFHREDAAPMTSAKAEIVRMIGSAVKEQRGINPKPHGIGGGTCAAFFRRAGYPAAVWSTIVDIAHQPNEYANIDDMVADAKVFAALCVM